MSSLELQIHMATPENAPGVAKVLRESFLEFQPLYTPAGFAATTPNPDRS